MNIRASSKQLWQFSNVIIVVGSTKLSSTLICRCVVIMNHLNKRQSSKDKFMLCSCVLGDSSLYFFFLILPSMMHEVTVSFMSLQSVILGVILS